MCIQNWERAGDLSLKFSFRPLCSTVVAALNKLVSHLTYDFHDRWLASGMFLVLMTVNLAHFGDNCRTTFLTVVSTFLLLDAAAKNRHTGTVMSLAAQQQCRQDAPNAQKDTCRILASEFGVGCHATTQQRPVKLNLSSSNLEASSGKLQQKVLQKLTFQGGST